LNGVFQRFEFIADNREAIRESWLRLDAPLPYRVSGDFAICLCFNEPEGLLRENDVRHLAALVSHQRFFLLTDQPSNPMLEALRDLGAEIVCGDEMERFRFIHSCQKVAISQSALHWWGAFLGAAREIYFPPIDRGPWSHPEPAKFAYEPEHYGIDLRVTDEKRWIYDWWK
jgi:hypothetical protein